MTVSVASDAFRQPRFHAYSAIAEPSSCATFPYENASRPFGPNRFGPEVMTREGTASIFG